MGRLTNTNDREKTHDAHMLCMAKTNENNAGGKTTKTLQDIRGRNRNRNRNVTQLAPRQMSVGRTNTQRLAMCHVPWRNRKKVPSGQSAAGIIDNRVARTKSVSKLVPLSSAGSQQQPRAMHEALVTPERPHSTFSEEAKAHVRPPRLTERRVRSDCVVLKGRGATILAETVGCDLRVEPADQ